MTDTTNSTTPAAVVQPKWKKALIWVARKLDAAGGYIGAAYTKYVAPVSFKVKAIVGVVLLALVLSHYAPSKTEIARQVCPVVTEMPAVKSVKKQVLKPAKARREKVQSLGFFN